MGLDTASVKAIAGVTSWSASLWRWKTFYIVFNQQTHSFIADCYYVKYQSPLSASDHQTVTVAADMILALNERFDYLENGANIIDPHHKF